MKSVLFSLASVLLAGGLSCSAALPATPVAKAANSPGAFRPTGKIGQVTENPGFNRANSSELTWPETHSTAEALLHAARIHNVSRVSASSPKLRPVKTRKAPGQAIGGSTEGHPTLMGCVSYADSWNITGEGQVGIYEIGPEALEIVSLQEKMLTSYGQVYAGDKYFATEPTLYGSWVYDMSYHIYDTSSWTESAVVPGNYYFNARAMAFDPMSRRAYAITRDDDYYYYLAVMDMNTYDYKNIGKLGTDDWSALMCAADGSVYGIRRSGELVSFDKTTAAITTIGQTGLGSPMMTAGTIDPATGRCFYIYYSGYSSDLYEIDLETAKPTYLYEIPENAQILSLFVPETPVAENGPAAAAGLSALFEGESLSGNVTFTLPSATVSGAALSGTVSYSLLVNGTELTSGQGAAGDEVSCPVTLDASGEYTFTVKVSTADAEGASASVTAWIGYALPAAPSKVALKVADDKLSLSWQEVKVPGAQISYTVISYPSGEVVAENLTDLAYTCDIPVTDELTAWTFGVIAVNGDSRSSESLSNGYISGYLTLPYSQDFELESSRDYFTFVDANEDGKTWEWQFFAESGRLRLNYSYSKPQDDWAVLHPVKFERGKLYTISADIKGTGSYYTEKMEFVVARGNDAASLAEGTVILAPFEFSGEDYATYEASFIAQESGVYYVAFHAISDTFQNIIYLDNVAVSKGSSALAPAAVTDLVVTPDASGALSALLTFNYPVKNMVGDNLTAGGEVIIERDGDEIGRVEASEPGQALQFTDDSPANGSHRYVVTPSSADGRGVETEVSAYIGLTAPKAPVVAVEYGANTGEAVVTWEAPTHDLMGHELGNTPIVYNVQRVANGSNPLTVATGLTSTQFTEQCVDPSADQVFVNYIVEAEAIGGISDGGLSNIYPLGRPEATPARESFGGRVTDYEWGAEASPESFTSWDVYPGSELGIDTYDGGSAVVAYNAYYSDDNTSALISSLFDLTGLEKPVLTFYLYDFMESENRLTVSVNNGKGWTILGDVPTGETHFDWKRKTVDLSAFKDQVICISLLAEIVDYDIMAVDNLRITNDVDHNLAVLGITVPESVEANEEFPVTVSYENAGKNIAAGYTVDLYRDDELIESREGVSLHPEVHTDVTFNTSLAVTAPDAPVFKAVLNYAADQNESDNATPEASVVFLRPTLPAPLALTAVQNSDTEVTLSWNEPDFTTIVPSPSTDDLESYTPFSTGLPTSVIEGDNIGDWTVYDEDGLPTYTGTFDYPGVGEPMAFVVYNSHLQEDNVFGCHSGKQMFLSLASKPDGDRYNDDWLVSPELAGCEQEISFYAKSIDTYGVDKFQVLYSTTGKAIADFTLLSEQESTGDWTRYAFTLPEGTTYFAVRCISEDKYAFLLDDFRMISAKDAVIDLEIHGYNVYCDGKRVNADLLGECAHIHQPDLADGTYSLTYHVACVYNHGESAPSEGVQVDFTKSALDRVDAASAIRILAGKGLVVIKGLDGDEVTVADTAGHTLYHASDASGDLSVSLAPGLYIVRAGSVTAKAVVL